MTTKEIQEQIVANMKEWQKIENASVASTGAVIEKTDNAVVRLVMEIIQRDSHMHYRIQQLIIDSYEEASVPVLVDQLEQIWDTVEQHIKIEKRTIEMAEASLKALEGTHNVVAQYLLSYLLADEKKHDKLLTVHAKAYSSFSGTYPMPRFAISKAFLPAISCPLNLTEPSGVTSPMTALQVVERPTPLRPRRATISPSLMFMFTP
mgnify:CR=1 FL=1